MSLRDYNRKRNFSRTPEPKGKAVKKGKGALRFVVQMHRATRLHYDLRLEFEGTFKSWAVPRGPSLNPLDQRLAVFVEDHPLEYGSFEGIIPPRNYGAGSVMVWDEGTYVERGSLDLKLDRKRDEAAMRKGFDRGHMTFVFDGKKLKGEFALIRLKRGGDEKAWLLVKKRDAHATFKRGDVLDDLSVKTGRTMEAIAAESEAQGNVWLPKRQEAKPPKLFNPGVSRAKAVKAVKAIDPIPRRNKPMLPIQGREVPTGKNWVFDGNEDGLRALAEVEGKRVSLYSRSGFPFEKKFPEIVDELKECDLQAVLDGEIVQSKGRAFYKVFDVLYAQGRDLRKSMLKERKKALAQIHFAGKHVQPAPAFQSAPSGRSLARNLESPYIAGTSIDWLIVNRATASVGKSETPASAPSPSEEPRLTHLDKVYWPKEGYTKGDLVEYYRAIAPKILPYLKDRPESLNRHPGGIASAGFYQKDMTGHIPRWLKTVRMFSGSTGKSIDYALCQDERSLLYFANLGCIEINPWFSKAATPDHPDFMVIDLDPDDNDFDHVIEVAHEVRRVLESVGADCYCKTSGATGIHIGVPTGARYDFDQVREFAERVCQVVAQKFPASTSLERNPARRRGKIYLDFLQNRRGQTLAAPFCVRPRPGAPVSMPLEWKELKPGLKPEHFNLKNAPVRILKKKDPWKGVLGAPIALKKCSDLLRKKFKV
jgi:bifunctional non-homologous end joining protein LigD